MIKVNGHELNYFLERDIIHRIEQCEGVRPPTEEELLILRGSPYSRLVNTFVSIGFVEQAATTVPRTVLLNLRRQYCFFVVPVGQNPIADNLWKKFLMEIHP